MSGSLRERAADRELEDALGVGDDEATGIEGDSEAESKAESDLREFTSLLRDEGKDVLVRQDVTEQLETLREGVIEGHAAFERRYEENRERFERTADRSAAKNPTAVSLLPDGPLPNSASTRFSTVPKDLPYAMTEALPRIYGPRWKRDPSAGPSNR